jgi:hypothetical protein
MEAPLLSEGGAALTQSSSIKVPVRLLGRMLVAHPVSRRFRFIELRYLCSPVPVSVTTAGLIGSAAEMVSVDLGVPM